ncbi:MAG: response regulator [Candidatus Marinimicrobia bacterium]|nr:response regulator [Candidatus Neomarinimicrobiota bacterium]
MEIKKTSCRVLVIDDKAVLKIVEEVLTNLKHNVTVCSSPKAGQSRFRKENFDMVITNLNMPEMSG